MAVNFTDCLDRGLAFERDTVGPLLHQLYPDYVIKNFAKSPTERFGPRAFRGDKKQEEFVLPDFELFHPETGDRFWVDAKLKKQPFYNAAFTRELLVSLDIHVQQKYAQAMAVLPGTLFLIFGIENTNNIYMTQWSPNPNTIYFNNKWGRGNTPVYKISSMRHIGVI